MYDHETLQDRNDDPLAEIYGNSDTGWFITYGLRIYGPFDSYDEANSALDEMLRGEFGDPIVRE